MTDSAATEFSNLSISKENRFIEVVIDQDVRLKRIVPTLTSEKSVVEKFDFKDVNVARAKLDEAAIEESLAEENVARLEVLLGDSEIERSGN